MIIISSRKNFDTPDEISSDGHHVREIDLNNNNLIDTLDISSLIEKIRNKKVLILVHGYNNKQLEVYDAYQTISRKINDIVPNEYDHVIGYTWPGGNKGYKWEKAKSTANDAAKLFSSLIETISKSSTHLDLMSHSLGARVCMSALKKTPDLQLVRNYYCTAAAVDNESLELGKEFSDSVISCGRIFIFHSFRDGVLRLIYEAAEKNKALGLYGPEDKNYIYHEAEMIYVINCKEHITNHSSYKKENAIYKYIKKYQTINPMKFKTI